MSNKANEDTITAVLVIDILSPYFKMEISKENPFLDESITSYQLVDRNHPLYSDLPYHNQEHCEQVASLALHLCLNELALQQRLNELSSIPPKFNRFSLQDHVLFPMLAGLLHDVKHSGGATTDRENIIRTQKEVIALFPDNEPTKRWAERINRIIGYTQYPHTVVPETLVPRCVVDADILLTCMLKDSTTVLVEGLLKEMNTHRDDGDKITQHEFYQQQTEFHRTLGGNLNTIVAKQLYLKYSYLSLIRLKEHLGE